MIRFKVYVDNKLVGHVYHFTWFEAQWAAVRRFGEKAKAEE